MLIVLIIICVVCGCHFTSKPLMISVATMKYHLCLPMYGLKLEKHVHFWQIQEYNLDKLLLLKPKPRKRTLFSLQRLLMIIGLRYYRKYKQSRGICTNPSLDSQFCVPLPLHNSPKITGLLLNNYCHVTKGNSQITRLALLPNTDGLNGCLCRLRAHKMTSLTDFYDCKTLAFFESQLCLCGLRSVCCYSQKLKNCLSPRLSLYGWNRLNLCPLCYQ